MYLIACLGNPGDQYRDTRHNVGFVVGERLRAAAGQEKWSEKFGGKFVKTSIGDVPAVIVLPQTYMNRSGEVVSPFMNFFKLSGRELVVIYDEVDLEPGVLRIQCGGSPAGHKGVRDIIDQLGTDDFYRIRIGVGHPRSLGEQATIDMNAWVLGRPSAHDKAAIADAEQRAEEAVRLLITEGLEKTQMAFNRKQ